MGARRPPGKYMIESLCLFSRRGRKQPPEVGKVVPSTRARSRRAFRVRHAPGMAVPRMVPMVAVTEVFSYRRREACEAKVNRHAE